MQPTGLENYTQAKNLLRDDNLYYGDFGKSYISNSDIGALLDNPASFRKERPDGKSLAQGRLFHQSLLEPQKVGEVVSVDASNRNTKIYKDSLDALGLQFALLKSEVEEVNRWVSVIKSNISFYDDIYADNTTYEEPEIGSIFGTLFKGKADIVRPDCVIDLKTSSDINKFKWSASAYNYDSQCFIYQQLFNKPLVFYVIDKETYQLGIFRPTDSFVQKGQEKVERAIRVYEKYFGPNATEDVANHYIDEILL